MRAEDGRNQMEEDRRKKYRRQKRSPGRCADTQVEDGWADIS